MPAVTHRWTAADVRALRDASPLATPRYELVGGELLVTPGPRPLHQLAVMELVVPLHGYLRANPIGEVLTSPADVELEPEFLSQPDVFVVPMSEFRRIRTESLVRRLLVACEVLSPSSLRHDRVTKRPYYQRSVSEYWIADLQGRHFDRWRPGDARAEILTEELRWHPAGAANPFVLNLPAFFGRVFGEP